jgi:DNA-binding response OmpR family regulator
MSRILYVEDEPFLAKVVRETLELKDFTVTHISNGSEVIPSFQTNNFELCVLDIMLPGRNGFDIAKDIRAIDNQIPILILSAKDQTADVIKGFELGANDYMRKPFSIEELIVRIQYLLKSKPAPVSEKEELVEYSIGSMYRFYPKRFELAFDSSSKKLSHKETQILELLCQNKNEVTERKDILLKAWGDDSFYNSRNLDVYITKLRGYLAKDPNVAIVTLKGVGYQFRDG